MEEIQKLIKYIQEKGYDYEIRQRDYTDYDGNEHKGLQVYIKSIDFSAIWIHGSYGYEKGLIEVMCNCQYYEGSVIGSLTAQECINILENYDILEKLSKERETEIQKNIDNCVNFYDTQIADIIQGETK